MPLEVGLVLTRAKDEQIMIGDDIVITLVDIWGDKARIGIKAPHTVPVHRREVYDRIKAGTLSNAYDLNKTPIARMNREAGL